MRRITDDAQSAGDASFLEVEGVEVKLTNLDRVLYPETGFTKRDLIDYYAAVAPVLLPHLAGRPVTMRRFPSGVEEEGFWEKHCPEFRPEWVDVAAIESSSSSKGTVDYCLVNDLPTLIWVANLACVELHVSLAGAETRSHPDSIVFDLDPGKPADVMDCAEIAFLIRDTLQKQGLETFAKVSGSKGIQLYLPLNTESDYEVTGGFAKTLAQTFEQAMPDRVVSRMKKSLRPGKVLIDWSQNSKHKTTVAVYSMRAMPQPSVSTPVSWEELETALENDDPSGLRFSPDQVLERVASTGDLFSPVLETKQAAPGSGTA